MSYVCPKCGAAVFVDPRFHAYLCSLYSASDSLREATLRNREEIDRVNETKIKKGSHGKGKK